MCWLKDSLALKHRAISSYILQLVYTVLKLKFATHPAGRVTAAPRHFDSGLTMLPLCTRLYKGKTNATSRKFSYFICQCAVPQTRCFLAVYGPNLLRARPTGHLAIGRSVATRCSHLTTSQQPIIAADYHQDALEIDLQLPVKPGSPIPPDALLLSPFKAWGSSSSTVVTRQVPDKQPWQKDYGAFPYEDQDHGHDKEEETHSGSEVLHEPVYADISPVNAVKAQAHSGAAGIPSTSLVVSDSSSCIHRAGADTTADAASAAGHGAGAAAPASAPERLVQGSGGPGAGGGGPSGPGGPENEYAVNYGHAVEALRADIPQTFAQAPDWSVYTRDVVLVTPWATLEGLRALQLLHMLLRGLSRTLYSHTHVELLRLWQPRQGLLRARWRASAKPRLQPARISGWGSHLLRSLWPRQGSGGQWTMGDSQENHPGQGRPMGRQSQKGHSHGEPRIEVAGHGGHAESSSASASSAPHASDGQMHRGTDATDKGDREYMEVVATYKFNSKGFIFEHVIDTVVPPEPPMLLWPVVWVAKLLAGGRPGGQRQQLPIPEAINRQ